jgi:hypothetical protein
MQSKATEYSGREATTPTATVILDAMKIQRIYSYIHIYYKSSNNKTVIAPDKTPIS